MQRAASEVHALSNTAFDATDPALLEQFFSDLPTSLDHIMVRAGRPPYRPFIDQDCGFLQHLIPSTDTKVSSIPSSNCSPRRLLV
jgi:hypothetical protein